MFRRADEIAECPFAKRVKLFGDMRLEEVRECELKDMTCTWFRYPQYRMCNAYRDEVAP